MKKFTIILEDTDLDIEQYATVDYKQIQSERYEVIIRAVDILVEKFNNIRYRID